MHVRRWFQFSTRGLLVVTAAFGVVIFAGWRLFGPAVPPHLLNRVREGMNQEEIRAILGPPQEVNENEWKYWRALNPGWVEVRFDEQGRVSSINDESAFL